jgi:hypothetical protein
MTASLKTDRKENKKNHLGLPQLQANSFIIPERKKVPA